MTTDDDFDRQIQAYLDLPVLHTAELLALLYEGKDPLA